MTAIQFSLTIKTSREQKTNDASQDLIHFLGIFIGNTNSSQNPIKQCRSRKIKILKHFKEE